MTTFLEEIAAKTVKDEKSLANTIYILPSKRAGTFLRNNISKTIGKTSFAPTILSIESFVEMISGLSFATTTHQLFVLYESYLQTFPGEKEDFHSFSKWAQTILQDFNEIDRYLVDSKKIFSHLSRIQEINHWYLQKEKTQMIEDYIQFWENLEPLYIAFNQNLLATGIGHQGMVYRKACDRVHSYLAGKKDKFHVFAGFNALNHAESQIIQAVLSHSNAEIFWDTDPYFIDDPVHDAGYFIRQYRRSWPYLQGKPLKGIQDNFKSEKKIKIIGVPKNVSQVKYIGRLLKEQLPNSTQQNTAVVLGSEDLLNPLLNALPEAMGPINITMGYPLNKTSLSSLFSQYFELYINQNSEGLFYQNLLDFLSHPYIHILLRKDQRNLAALLTEEIKAKNWTFLTPSKIKRLVAKDCDIPDYLFTQAAHAPKQFLESSLEIIGNLKEIFLASKDYLGLEYLYHFYALFNQLLAHLEKYPFINELRSLYSLYNGLIRTETLDFEGEPLQGIQIMGMLESRNLDFETVIITSVNEGILPSGKSNNSFIPYDVKQSFGLPTFKEKDAVYTYHFYRLLQRAKNIYLLYNTEPDVLEGGEKSRLIMQLLTDGEKAEGITEVIASPEISPSKKIVASVTKDKDLMEAIANLAERGISPSSLTNYIRNPMDFYKRSILKIDDTLEVEETVAANTFGTIVHDALEELYLPLVGTYLSEKVLIELKPKIKGVVQSNFTKSYSEGDISRGKNFIAFHVIVRYIENFIQMELEMSKGHQIKIIGLEQTLEMPLKLPVLGYPVLLRGKLDRIDEVDGQLRIIDYKTGRVTGSEVELADWEDVIANYNRSKAFQLLCYALLYQSQHPVGNMEAGIISFKNLNSGTLNFAIKEKGSRNKDTVITSRTLSLFKTYLEKLVLEICDPSIPFTEKPV
ncbi:PD-(D/E)XK nuclease family protein [Flavobacteriaceae bacterium F89]|uniref:PD-(D/E)XK nuclease family protein n=1 Tax=Cerina litoralis TaxID=2874477 RepID=A0AAE3JPN6_9FLAO|nr:PD-(D/E)XK nuclease family protein [Cerina litoralis]MCG2459328.1 PD-(D/E)XK nuclease family protein [Cerina litoralis]